MLGNIDVVCTLNRTHIPATKGQKLFLKIDIVPIQTAAGTLRLNVCLLIDRSGSMAGNKLDNAKKGAVNLINQLESRDYAGIVTFESRIEVVVPGQHVTDKRLFEAKIGDIGAGNTTELYAGLRAAFAELQKPLHTRYGPGEEPVRRIILLSDGQPTDKECVSDYRALAREMRKTGISITALGIGGDYNEDLLSALAEESGGVWYHLTSPEMILELFSREVNHMKTVSFSQPELSVCLGEGAELEDFYKSNPEAHRVSNMERAGNEYRVPMRDIRAGESQTFVARIAVPPRSRGECRIAQVTILSGGFKKTEDVVICYTDDVSLWGESNPSSRTLFAVTETQIKAKDGLSGDETALRQAQTQLETLLRDPDVTKVREIAERTTLIEEVIDKTKGSMSEEERKRAKSDLTHVGR